MQFYSSSKKRRHFGCADINAFNFKYIKGFGAIAEMQISFTLLQVFYGVITLYNSLNWSFSAFQSV